MPSTPYSRLLGDELRSLRETSTRLSGSALATLLRWDQSKVSNIENGKSQASEIDLVQYLAMCGKDRAFINDFLDRYRNAFNTNFVQVSQDLRAVALAENMAATITSYDPVALPALLQTPEYAAELLVQRGLTPASDIDAVVGRHMERQSLLRRHDPPLCRFYLHEKALRPHWATGATMQKQLRRLTAYTDIIRIVPDDRALPLASCYVLWEYDNAPPVAFSESDIARVFSQDNDAVIKCRTIFTALATAAMNKTQARNLLKQLASNTDDHAVHPDQTGARS